MARLRYFVVSSFVTIGLVACAAPHHVSPPPIATTTTSAAPIVVVAPELVSFPSGTTTLRGYLWKPPGAGPFPTILYSHGSEEYPGSKEGQAKFFLAHGYALFVPHRRGQGQSKHAGEYIGTIYNRAGTGSQAFPDELVAQNDDVKAAAEYLAKQPWVDKKRIAAVGCSLGGIESLLAAERVPGIAAAVDFAGGSQTWATNQPLQERMKSAAEHANVPVFFVQAENDYNTAPSRTLSDVMTKAGKKNRLEIYPPNGTTPGEGHAFCIGGDAPPWGDHVLAFLHEAGM